MDSVADDMARRKLGDVLRTHKATLSREQSYAADDFKFNPYGIVVIDRR